MASLSIPQKTGDPVTDICIDTLEKNKQAFIFVNSKRSAQKVATDIAKHMVGNEKLKELSDAILHALTHPTDQCKKLSACVAKGVAFHHAGLSSAQRQMIEDAFREGFLKLIACTPTLAAGIDMPAFRTIIRDVKRFSGFGMNFIPVLEYHQMAGRAGRPGKETYGESIVLASTEREKKQLTDQYVYGQPESIQSKLAVEPVLRMYVLSLVATGVCRTEEELIKFFSQSFWAHQFEDMSHIEKLVRRVVDLLISYTFLHGTQKETKNDRMSFVSADELQSSSSVLVATELGIRVSQLYLDPLTANQLVQALSKPQLMTFGLIHALSMTLEMRPQLRIKVSETDAYNQFLFEHEKELLVPMPTVYDYEYEDFFASLKTTSYALDWMSEFGEDKLLDKYDIRPGELNAKNDIFDWLLYCCAEICQVKNWKQHISLIQKTRTRIKYGIKEELLPLIQLKGIGKVRARDLFDAGFKTLASLKTAQVSHLAKVVGNAVAIDIHKQLGIHSTISAQQQLL